MRTSPHARARFTIAGLGIAAVVALAACSNAATSAPAGDTSIDPTRSIAGGFDAAASAALPESGSNSDQGLPAASGQPANPVDPALAVPDADIVRTGSISIEVAKIDPALAAVRTAILGLGGYVSDSDQSNSPDQEAASVTYRVPVDHWQDALDAVDKIASKVDSAKSNAVEVTGQVLDLGARIDNLQTTERALQTIMGQATKISDILAVESQLSDVQGQIEELTTQQNHLRDQAALATLTVDFALPPTQAVVETSRGWDPGAQLDQASAALLGIGQALASGGIWLVVVGLPLGLLILIVLGLAWLVARRVRRLRPSEVATPPAEA